MSKYQHKWPLSHICTNHSLRYIHSVTIWRCTSNSDLEITWFGAVPPRPIRRTRMFNARWDRSVGLLLLRNAAAPENDYTWEKSASGGHFTQSAVRLAEVDAVDRLSDILYVCPAGHTRTHTHAHTHTHTHTHIYIYIHTHTWPTYFITLYRCEYWLSHTWLNVIPKCHCKTGNAYLATFEFIFNIPTPRRRSRKWNKAQLPVIYVAMWHACCETHAMTWQMTQLSVICVAMWHACYGSWQMTQLPVICVAIWHTCYGSWQMTQLSVICVAMWHTSYDSW